MQKIDFLKFLNAHDFVFQGNPDETDIYIYRRDNALPVRGLRQAIIIEVEREDVCIYEFQYWLQEGDKERIDWIKRFSGEIKSVRFFQLLLKSIFPTQFYYLK